MVAEYQSMTGAHPVPRLAKLAKMLSQRVALAGVLGMLAVSILTTIDVVFFRNILSSPIAGSNEILATIFAVTIAAVLPSGLAERGMLEVDLISSKLGDRRSDWFRLFGAAALLFTVVVVAWQVSGYALNAYEIGRQTVVLQWKTWPFLFLIAVMFVLCVPVQFIVVLDRIFELTAPNGGEANASGEISHSQPQSFLKVALLLTLSAVATGVIVYFVVQALGGTRPGAGSLLAFWLFLAIWALVLFLVPVAVSLFVVSLIGTAILMGFPISFSIVGAETTALITNANLAVIPLFLIMGGLATAGGMASDVYRLASSIFGFQRGGLALATIGGAAGFGALTGTSLATVATIGRAAFPEMEARGYSKAFATGTIAAGGTLGQIIPPSTAAVLYALLVEESIGALYIAMLVPALISIVLYFATAWTVVTLRPDYAPGREKFDLKEFLAALRASTSSFVLFGLVIGGIFTGWFTATEAAAVGVLIAFIVALTRGNLKGEALWRLVVETTQATAMLYFILIAAAVFSFFVSVAGLPDLLRTFFDAAQMSPFSIILLLVVGFLLMGTIMDAFTILIVTTPIVASIVAGLGYDLIWWGVIMVVVIEIGVISPPFGMNIFVMKSVAPDVPLSVMYKGVLPFVLADIVKVILLLAFPALTLWLPSLSAASP
jgi:tripartite ATP-independent transporter DctM subunit